jgi:hypothetical protein
MNHGLEVRIVGERSEDALPDTTFAPAVEAPSPVSERIRATWRLGRKIKMQAHKAARMTP